jgi:hypothetical protein
MPPVANRKGKLALKHGQGSSCTSAGGLFRMVPEFMRWVVSIVIEQFMIREAASDSKALRSGKHFWAHWRLKGHIALL